MRACSPLFYDKMFLLVDVCVCVCVRALARAARYSFLAAVANARDTSFFPGAFLRFEDAFVIRTLLKRNL